jgi:hypothetical protein
MILLRIGKYILDSGLFETVEAMPLGVSFENETPKKALVQGYLTRSALDRF